MKGRPPKFETVEQIQAHIDNYFHSLKIDQPPTITGLGLWLNLTRQGLVEYGEKEIFSDTIKKAKQRVEQYNEERLHSGKAPAGVIFNLKNNFRWEDKTSQDVNSTTKIVYIDKEEKDQYEGHIDEVTNE